MLKRYAKKLGLNDRGCYLAIGLAIITFFLLVIIVAMAISWPGESRHMTRLYTLALKRQAHEIFDFCFFINQLPLGLWLTP
jgi:hypothetical protein